MQMWPLERKILVTQAKILEWYHHYSGKVAVSFSGGKDSTVLLDLVRRAFPDIPAVFVDTGLEYPEIREFVRTIPNVTWLRPEMPFSKVWLSHHLERRCQTHLLCAARQPMGNPTPERLERRRYALKIQ